MKRFVVLMFLLFAASHLYAQTSQVDAQAAYLLAEENYGKGNYTSALKFLESAKKSLGGANCKILYLQIVTEAELAKAKPDFTGNVLKTIAEFENTPDVKTFNEEKVLEVAKLKLSLTAENEERISKEKKEAEYVATGKRNFDSLKAKGWPVNIDIEELKTLNKDSILFQRRLKDRFEKELGLTLYYVPDVSYSGNSVVPDTYSAKNIFGVLVDGKQVKGYRRVVFHADPQSGTSYEDAGKWMKDYLQRLTNGFYKRPVFKPEGGENNYDKYSWTDGNKTFTIYHLHRFIRPTYWTQQVIMEIRYK